MTNHPDPAPNDGSPAGVYLGMRQLAIGGVIGFIGLGFSAALNFVHQFILAQMLSVAELGLFNLGAASSALIGLVVILGTDRAIVRLVAKYAATGETRRETGAIYGVFAITLILAGVIVPGLWLGAGWISSSIFQKPEFASTFRLFALSIPFSLLIRLGMGVFQAYKQTQVIAFVEQLAIPTLKVLLLWPVLLWLGYQSKAAAVSFLCSTAFGSAISVWLLAQLLRRRKEHGAPLFSLNEVIGATLPFFVVTLLNRTNTLTETLVIGAVSTSAQLGLYTLSLKMTATIAIFMEAFSLIFAPLIAELHSKHDLPQLAEQYKMVTYWVMTLTFPFVMILILKATEIMAIIGPEYAEGATVLQILTIAQFIYAIIGVSSLILVMTDRNNLNILNLLISIVVSITLDFALIPIYGALGAAIAGAATILLVNLLRLAQVMMIFRMSPFHGALLKPLGIGIVTTSLAVLVARIWTPATPLGQLMLFGGLLLGSYTLAMIVVTWLDGSMDWFFRTPLQGINKR